MPLPDEPPDPLPEPPEPLPPEPPDMDEPQPTAATAKQAMSDAEMMLPCLFMNRPSILQLALPCR